MSSCLVVGPSLSGGFLVYTLCELWSSFELDLVAIAVFIGLSLLDYALDRLLAFSIQGARIFLVNEARILASANWKRSTCG